MIPTQMQPLANHLWQSTLFAGAAGLLTLLLRRNRAHVRYWLWLAASIKFLVPFSILIDAGSHFGRQAAPAIAESGIPYAIEQVGQPFAAPAPLAPLPLAVQPPDASWIPAILWAVWAIGVVTLASRWWLRWRALRAALRSASPVNLALDMEVMSSPAFAEPGVFGVVRPVLLLPEGITGHLSPPQLAAILAHELCHVRRRDNLATTIHMAVEALFWFHPLVWWLGARLVEERERACDEEVLRLGSAPHEYAEGILRICELYLESPLPCVAGVTGSDLRKRIEEIMANRIAARLNLAKKVALACAGVGALAVPIVVGVLQAPPMRAQSPPTGAKFEVASVKPCEEDDNGGRGKRGGGGGFKWTPDRLHVGCVTLDNLIRDAYLSYPEGKPWLAATRAAPSPEAFGVPAGVGCISCGRGVSPVSGRFFRQPIQGSPEWASSDRYNIDAKAEGETTPEMMRGPMMQALLADRFKLKLHHEDKEVPVYELTVAKGGAKLQAAQEGNCITGPSQTQRAPGQAPPLICGRGGTVKGETYFPGATMAQLCSGLSGWLDRDVVDKTGIPGVFDIHLTGAQRVYLPDLSSAPPPADGPRRPPEIDLPATLKQLNAALPKLGLQLVPGKGLAPFLVIDHVERPSGN